ncbi:hypothetical protein SBRCBS47491_001037 [Sporothrix bragantina]|uniref:Uncharacterized protein n=1 Tax=Sporothrix bragantina TaxID=671064 RepID=A0ABP0AVA2_9PEZI
MGNLCGKVDKSDDPFDQPGRTLGGGNTRPAPAGAVGGQQAKTAPVPPRVGGPPRTLGGSSGGPGSSAAADARERAAAAAETGKLGAQLAAQKRENHGETLKKASEAEVRRREMDAQASAAAHN